MPTSHLRDDWRLGSRPIDTAGQGIDLYAVYI